MITTTITRVLEIVEKLKAERDNPGPHFYGEICSTSLGDRKIAMEMYDENGDGSNIIYITDSENEFFTGTTSVAVAVLIFNHLVREGPVGD